MPMCSHARDTFLAHQRRLEMRQETLTDFLLEDKKEASRLEFHGPGQAVLTRDVEELFNQARQTWKEQRKLSLEANRQK